MTPSGPHIDLKRGAVHIWSQRLSFDPAQVAKWTKMLTHEEIGRANSFYFQKDRDRCIASRAILRLLLSRYTQISVHKLPLAVTPLGKPYLVNSDIFFNLSHSGDYLVYAITKQSLIGIDIEKIKTTQDLPILLKSCLTPREYAELEKLPPADQFHTFYQLFTSKESYIKALGIGLNQPLDTLELLFYPQQTSFSLHQRSWQIWPVNLHSDYACHFAIEGEALEVFPKDLSCDL